LLEEGDSLPGPRRLPGEYGLSTLAAAKKFKEEAHPARAPVLRKARHARDPEGTAQDGPRRSAGPGLGLADADQDDRAYRAPAPARQARLWPGWSWGSASDHAGSEAGADQPGLVHQDQPVPRGQGRAATQLPSVGSDAGLHKAHPEGTRARAGRAGA